MLLHQGILREAIHGLTINWVLYLIYSHDWQIFCNVKKENENGEGQIYQPYITLITY